jgi:hypothetical protein
MMRTSKTGTIRTFGGECVDENKTGIGSCVDGGLGGREVPEQTRTVLICLLLQRVEGC